MKLLTFLTYLFWNLFWYSTLWAAEPLSLEAALSRALEKNFTVQAFSERAQAEHAAIRSQYALEQPMVGLMSENNITPMEQTDGPMRTWSITQDIRFPLKYFWLGSAQKAKAGQADEELSGKKLEIRKKVITAYYKLFGLSRILDLQNANLESARKTARTAETRHSTGQVPQQDEMKAHVEETRINTEILLAVEEKEAVSNELISLLGLADDDQITLPSKELPIPTLHPSLTEISTVASRNSRLIRAGEHQLKEAEDRRTLALLGYLPDFRFSYRRAYSNSLPDAYTVGVEATLPLWFFLKQTSENSSASALVNQAQHSLTQSQIETKTGTHTAANKARNRHTLLSIYETSLVPQAQATYNSSEAAYRAGKVSLLELLDSQRAFYQTRIAYYRMLADYAEALSDLESMTGSSVSNLPLPPDKL